MASLADIRKSIRSVKSTHKITGAMKLVAASKLRRAQDAILAARPYAIEVAQTIRRVAASVPTEEGEAPHPLLEKRRQPKRVLLVVLSSDRGLCGSFNVNALRLAERFIEEHKDDWDVLEIASMGRRARDHFAKKKQNTVRNFEDVYKDLTFRKATDIADGLAEEYEKTDLDAVYLVYSEFKNAISQELKVVQVLPVEPLDDAAEGAEAAVVADYLYEESLEGVLDRLVPRYLAVQIWRALLESSASEHGARMTAMASATKNAKEIVDRLTLQYNRARQAAITSELMEIISGAEALNG